MTTTKIFIPMPYVKDYDGVWHYNSWFGICHLKLEYVEFTGWFTAVFVVVRRML